MPSNAQHSAETPRWGTPADIVERARRVMGGIDLDPCSSAYFNQTVQASQYYSLDDRGEDGLALPWYGKVFCNPPGGLVKEFWAKAWNELVETYTGKMIWIGFSLEQLTYLQDHVLHPMDCCFVLLRKRLKFVRDDGYSASPTHGNYICGYKVDAYKFKEEFGPLGRVSFGEHAKAFSGYKG